MLSFNFYYILFFTSIALSVAAYNRTRYYFSLLGITTMVSSLFLIIFRIIHINEIPTNFYNPQRLGWAFLSVVLFSVYCLAGFIYLGGVQPILSQPKYFANLLVAYLVFGLLQQVLFQFVITDSLFKLFNGNIWITTVISGLIYFSFHLSKLMRRYFYMVIAFGLAGAFIYLNFGNAYLIGLLHGIVGATFFTIVSPSVNYLEARLKPGGYEKYNGKVDA